VSRAVSGRSSSRSVVIGYVGRSAAGGAAGGVVDGAAG
jgi:hypothetical protein